MGEIEVRTAMPMSVAELGGLVRKGQYLRVDGDNLRIQALISAGYLKLTDALEDADVFGSVDSAGADSLSGSGVAVGVEGPKKRGRPKKTEKLDGPELSGDENVAEVAQ